MNTYNEWYNPYQNNSELDFVHLNYNDDFNSDDDFSIDDNVIVNDEPISEPISETINEPDNSANKIPYRKCFEFINDNLVHKRPYAKTQWPMELLYLDIREINKYIKDNKLTQTQSYQLKKERRRFYNRLYARGSRDRKRT
jgi:hypothetical protein